MGARRAVHVEGDLLVIDGRYGEGGGQMLRTALGLSLRTGTPFRIESIRAGRSKPGLLRQHLTCIEAAVAVSGSRTEGAALGATDLTFVPSPVRGGRHHLRIGSAGSTVLVVHALLPGLLEAEGPTELTVEGGTDAEGAPTPDHFVATFVEPLRAVGVAIDVRVERRGFFPAGGGRLVLRVEPASVPALPTPDVAVGPAVCVVARCAGVPEDVGLRECAAFEAALGRTIAGSRVDRIDAACAGNTLEATLDHGGHRDVVSVFGRRGLPSEAVGRALAARVRAVLRAGAQLEQHTADQRMLLDAMAGVGCFSTDAITPHAMTHKELLEAFLPVTIGFEPDGPRTWVRTSPRPA